MLKSVTVCVISTYYYIMPMNTLQREKSCRIQPT